MIVRSFVAITFSRLKEKPMTLSRQHHCKTGINTICKSNFSLQMISVAFQANPNHVLQPNDFQSGRFEHWRTKFNITLS